MYEDDPQDKVFDVLGEAVFGDHPLGRADHRPRRRDRRRAGAETIAGFHDARYVPGNIVVAAAGSVDHDALVELVERGRAGAAGDGAARPRARAPTVRRASVRFQRKDTEQYHVCLGAPGIARDDERRFALRVLDTILGGTSSSRLFQEVREKRGLAYSVYSFSSQYARHRPGRRCTSAPAPTTSAEALSVIGRRAAPPARRAGRPPRSWCAPRRTSKGRIVLSLESTSARMNRLGALGADGHAAAVARRADRAASTRSRSTTSRALARRAARARRACRPPASGPTRTPSAPRSSRSARAPQRRRDPRRRRRRRRPDGRRRSARRSRARTTWSWSAAPTRRSAPRSPTCSATPTSSSTSPRPTPRSRTRASASRPACTS